MAAQVLRAAAASGRIPLIHFLGKRSIPESIDHAPRPHPQNLHTALPKSFAGPWGKTLQDKAASNSTIKLPVYTQPKGQLLDRSELPRRFWRLRLSKSEMQAIEDGAAFI